MLLFIALLLSACSEGGSFVGWQTETFEETLVTESTTKTFSLGNNSSDTEQRISAIAFDRGSNAAGHFRIDGVQVGDQSVGLTDIVIPPGSGLDVTVTYSPMNLDITRADWGGWVTGEEKRWEPIHPDLVGKETEEEIIQRAVIEAVYDHPKDGIFYVQVVGMAAPGPEGEEEAGGAFASCTPGNGVACYEGGFALDIPELAPGGPKDLEITGPIRFAINGGEATLRMDDFPYAIFYLRSEEIPQLPSGVTATLVISGAQGVEATGTYDGARLTLEGVAFRIRVSLGELSSDQLRAGMSAMVDFVVEDLTITTIKPLGQDGITLHMETKLSQNPSGNELFDQFLSGSSIIAIMEGDLLL